MAYHIKLGNKDDLRQYSIAGDGLSMYKESANPFAAKLNTDQDFGDVEGWMDWTVKDWSMGLGNKDPEEGFLYGQADTRFPNQVLLPMGLDYPDTDEQIFSGNDYAAGDHTVDGVTTTKISQSFTTGSSARQFHTVWVYLNAVSGTVVTASLYDDSSNSPGSTEHTTGTATVTKYRPGPIWLRIGMGSSYTMGTTTKYHVVVSGTASLTLPKINTTEYGNTYNGATWSSALGYQMLTSFIDTSYTLALEVDAAGDDVILEADDAGDQIELVGASTSRIAHMAEANGTLYCAYGFEVRYWDASSSTWISVDTLATEVVSMVSTGTDIFWSYNTGLSKVVPATSKTTVTDYTDDADILAMHKGLLYKSDGHNVYYSADGTDSSWTGPYAVGSSAYSIRGMASLGDELYMSKDEAMYILAPGDYVVGIQPWPTTSSVNGRGMTTWMSDLYIPLAEDLIQYNEGGGLVQMGLKRAEGLPDDVQGVIQYLHPTQYFLLASVAPPEGGAFGSVWAFNGQGWHGICLLPQDSYGGAMWVDTTENKLWLGGDYGITARLKYPSSVLNPANTASEKLFARYGWVDYDWFYGGPVELQKDIESAFLFAEETATGQYFTVYWQDEDSTDWEQLGTFTTDGSEVRWTSYTPGSVTRPDTRRIRIGILLRTDDETKTPILRAMRIKFHTMISDRWRFYASIETHDNLNMLGATLNAYQQSGMDSHLEDMVQSIPPVILEWYDGNQYEVKVTSATVRPQKIEMVGSTKTVQNQWDLTMESVVQGPYA